MKDDPVLVPRYLLHTLRPAGYFSRFYELVQASAMSHTQAFNALHDEQESILGVVTYDNYQSFRAGKCQYIRRGGLVRLLE